MSLRSHYVALCGTDRFIPVRFDEDRILTLLGGFQLSGDAGNTEALSARKTKALLAWLALHQDASQPRDRLALLLWEDSNDAQARHSMPARLHLSLSSV